MSFIVPTPGDVKVRVDHCGDGEMRACLRAAYEGCARISEIVGESSPGDTSEARGPRGIDAERTWYDSKDWPDNPQGIKARAWVIHIKTAKRKGMERLLGLPVDDDPWAMACADYFLSRGEELVFPFTRQAVTEFVHSNAVFEGFEWPVQDYRIFEAPAVVENGRVVQQAVVKKVEGHMKPFSVHSLRDCRATELLSRGFTGRDLAIHGGWAIQRMMSGITPTMARYLDVYRQWGWPFPKLMRKPLPSQPTLPPS